VYPRPLRGNLMSRLWRGWCARAIFTIFRQCDVTWPISCRPK
jgi:hypothetical protein